MSQTKVSQQFQKVLEAVRAYRNLDGQCLACEVQDKFDDVFIELRVLIMDVEISARAECAAQLEVRAAEIWGDYAGFAAAVAMRKEAAKMRARVNP